MAGWHLRFRDREAINGYQFDVTIQCQRFSGRVGGAPTPQTSLTSSGHAAPGPLTRCNDQSATKGFEEVGYRATAMTPGTGRKKRHSRWASSGVNWLLLAFARGSSTGRW